MNIIIDGSRFSTLDQFYDEMEGLLARNLTWRTGHNMSAFHDLLRGGFGVHACGESIDFLWLHAGKSRRDLGYEATARYWEEVLSRCHPTARPRMEAKRDAALARTGPTLFDLITEAILCETDLYHHTLRLDPA